MMHRAFLILHFVLATAALRAQSASATLDSQRITVGSPATLRLRVEAPTGTALQWPALPDSFGKLEVLSKGKVDTARRGGTVVYSQAIQVTGFDSGMFAVPSISFTTAGETPLQTESLGLLVQPLPADTTKPFRPIKGILEVPSSPLAHWPYALAALVVGVALWFLFRKRKPKAAAPKPRPTENPAAVALRQLAELQSSDLAKEGKMNAHYTRLSDILRRYLEDGFGLAAMEQPTDAMLRAIEKNDRLKTSHAPLRELFFTADLVKFARAHPTVEEAEQAVLTAKKFVADTGTGTRVSGRNR